MKKNNDNIQYIKIKSINDIDFEGLSEDHKRLLARAYSTLLRKGLTACATMKGRGQLLLVKEKVENE